MPEDDLAAAPAEPTGAPPKTPRSGQDEPPEPPDLSAPTDGGNDGHIVEIDIERELQDSYLTYAMSTIMDRALPDVRDGLKPSQRRILVAMNDLNLRPGKKHLKCAKIAGNTSGDYHPHGEGVIYPTLVGMAQSWKMRVPLIDPQGNFGSIEGDPPAAMRYTESRLTHAAGDMLADLKLDTVDYQPNYDERLVEPTILPGRFPSLLINGSVGIAVGMATSLAPHNPSEIFDAIDRVIDDPSIDLASLMTDELDDEGEIVRLGVKGPDFPTGGIILGRRGIMDAYSTGRGKVYVRGECHVEALANNREQIVIDSIPYMLMQSTLVERIVDAVKDERITDVSDVRNESGRNAQTRIVVELKRGGDAAVVENQLYRFTPLQQTFSMMNIALVNRRPRTLGLREMIDCHLRHRRDVVRRRTLHLLREAKKRAHLLEGMIYAVCDIDEVIRLIRASRTREEAIQALVKRRFRIAADHPYAGQIPQRLIDYAARFEAVGGVSLSRVQAETIGAMRLIQLVGLEIEKLAGDYTGLVAQIEEFEAVLADEGRVDSIIKQDIAAQKHAIATQQNVLGQAFKMDAAVNQSLQDEGARLSASQALRWNALKGKLEAQIEKTDEPAKIAALGETLALVTQKEKNSWAESQRQEARTLAKASMYSALDIQTAQAERNFQASQRNAAADRALRREDRALKREDLTFRRAKEARLEERGERRYQEDFDLKLKREERYTEKQESKRRSEYVEKTEKVYEALAQSEQHRRTHREAYEGEHERQRRKRNRGNPRHGHRHLLPAGAVRSLCPGAEFLGPSLRIDRTGPAS